MKLKVGMYVRFKNNKNIQYIGKIVNINEYREPCFKYAIEVTWYDDYIFIGDDDIIGEPSFDLIDLIKNEDIIETPKGKFEVGYVDNNVIYTNDSKVIACLRNDDHLCFENKKINAIITKEQFNACKYVVERDTNENI